MAICVVSVIYRLQVADGLLKKHPNYLTGQNADTLIEHLNNMMSDSKR